jgi:hypothetical protein
MTFIDDMKCSSSVMIGVKTANTCVLAHLWMKSAKYSVAAAPKGT